MRQRYEFATERDGEEVAALLENVDFKGDVSIAYARRPNAVRSIAKDGEKSAVCIARAENGELIGTGACTINKMHVRGEIVDVAYLTGLRAIRRGNIIKCYQMLNDFCKENKVKYTYTTILKENAMAQKMLEKTRPMMPDYIKHSTFQVNIIKKRLKIKDDYKLEIAAPGDLDLLSIRKTFHFAPVVKDYNHFYVLKDGSGEVLACGKVWEQWDYKQYIVKQYGFKYKLIRPLVRWLPKEDEVLRFFALSYVVAKDERALEAFLRHISNLDRCGNFFLYGGDDCPVPHFSYESFIYLVDWDKKGVPSEIMSQKMRIETALL